MRVLCDEECTRLLRAAGEANGVILRWDLFILIALCTGLRRGELFNTTWADIDFEKQVIRVWPKDDTEHTWEWHIKDTERRTLPLTDELVQLLVEHQAEQPEGYPYVFIPPKRYHYIQQLREKGKWSARLGNYPVKNFDRKFRQILERASIEQAQFHDSRRTCLTNWFAGGLSEFEVMTMAGHSSFETTRAFYLAIRSDLVDRTRKASSQAMKQILVARWLRAPSESVDRKSAAHTSDCGQGT